MANDFYVYTNDFIPDTPVRSRAIDTEFEKIEDAFDKLSNPSELAAGAQILATESSTIVNQYILVNGDDDELRNGQMMTFFPALTNTGPSTASFNSGPNTAITRNDGAALSANDLLAGVPVLLIYDIAQNRWVLAGATAEQNKSLSRPTVRTITADYTLTAADENALILANSASPIIVTAPSETSELLPIGFLCQLARDGAGSVSFTNDVGVTIEAPVGTFARLQESSISIFKTAANQYRVLGDQAA